MLVLIIINERHEKWKWNERVEADLGFVWDEKWNEMGLDVFYIESV